MGANQKAGSEIWEGYESGDLGSVPGSAQITLPLTACFLLCKWDNDTHLPCKGAVWPNSCRFVEHVLKGWGLSEGMYSDTFL